MKWYWKVRIYDARGHYWPAEIATNRTLQEIDDFQDFYKMLTGCKMLLEGMSEEPSDAAIATIQEAFEGLWMPKKAV
jgi:hypothetical protein